uniref:Guanine nucleotide-binding protein subunit beta-like protein (Cytoplasmic antigenic protein 1) n=1 Tax=Ganoderma boninense TaxID=34458 RepID=A0A5K1JY64_9APHY|nr:Guanine nucleotide-binding protein subunit beta-like protein (Cytoplasmic antigenic protein 1) [Ganoderma boninense]
MAKQVSKARRRYVETVRLTDGHSKGITCVEFNPDGTLLATGGLDGKVCLWDSETGKLQDTYTCDTSIGSLTWIPGTPPTLIVGNQNGNIVSLVFNKEDLLLKGFWAHKFPIEHLAFQDNLLASGAHSEVKVWKRNAENDYELGAVIQNPPTNSNNDDKEVIVTNLEWVPSGKHGTTLLVTYMYHGVQLLEKANWKRVRAFPFAKIAAASASQDGKHLAVSNLTKGFDVFSLESGESVRSFEHDALLGGSTVGKVGIWDLVKGKLSSPTIPNRAKVLAIAAHCEVRPKPAPFRFRIATATFSRQHPSICIIWEAREETASSSWKLPVRAYLDMLHSVLMMLQFAIIASTGLLIALLYAKPELLEQILEFAMKELK